jgi:hypothetical protein
MELQTINMVPDLSNKTFTLNQTPFLEEAAKVTVVGAITYVAKAPAGSLQASAVWKCKKIDETTGVVITWANGNELYNNIATDLTVLTYV